MLYKKVYKWLFGPVSSYAGTGKLQIRTVVVYAQFSHEYQSMLELRQCKDDSIDKRNLFVLKYQRLYSEWKSVAIPKQTNIVVALDVCSN